MKRIGYLVFGITMLLILAGLNGCAPSASLVNQWADPSFNAPPLNNILVIAVSGNTILRRQWEDNFVSELQKQHATATPSYRLFPDALPEKSALQKVANREKFDGFLIMRHLPPKYSEHYVPGYVTTEPTYAYDPFWNTYETYYTEVAHPGYTDVEKIYRQSIELWKAGDRGQLLWTGVTETTDPPSQQTAKQGVVQKVVSQLAGKSIIPQASRS